MEQLFSFCKPPRLASPRLRLLSEPPFLHYNVSILRVPKTLFESRALVARHPELGEGFPLPLKKGLERDSSFVTQEEADNPNSILSSFLLLLRCCSSILRYLSQTTLPPLCRGMVCFTELPSPVARPAFPLLTKGHRVT